MTYFVPESKYQEMDANHATGKLNRTPKKVFPTEICLGIVKQTIPGNVPNHMQSATFKNHKC